MQNSATLTSKCHKKSRKSDQKTTFGTRSIKHVENVLKWMPSDLPKTCFQKEGLQTFTKTRGADKYPTIPQNDVKMKPTSMKQSFPERNKNDA